MNREELIKKIQTHYRSDRLSRIDKDFLIFEEEMSTVNDLETILVALDKKAQLPNPHNSCLLYCTGLTSEFDTGKERCDTEGGSPPDIDIDFEAEGRDKAVELVATEWGRDNVANIITHGTLKPKSLTRRFFKLSTPDDYTKLSAHEMLMREVLDKIPDGLFGKDATLEETIKGNEEKGYVPRPELATDKKYAGWYKFANQLEDMVANFGIHAAGVVISEFPIQEQIPMWANSKAERITQYDMKEVEALGLIKFDFLSINNLDILKECVRLIKVRHGKDINIYTVPDGDGPTYKLLNSGAVQGIFQMETSKTAKELITEIQPQSIEDLSDISAINRPGPLQYAHEYATNKRLKQAPQSLPTCIAEIIKDTHYILLYQEQVMKICTDIAGYTLREADDIRRAMGKKKLDVLTPYKESFVKGCMKSGISEEYATVYWDKTLIPFADYSFNKSHSVAYSLVTYLCAYFKANYPTEFFTALMTIRSRVMQPKLWAEKAPEYIQEARNLGILINSPSVQTSEIGFTIVDKDIYFGLNGIRSVGMTASKAIMKARQAGKFKDIWDFMARIDQRVINTKVLEALIVAGAFDTMGYSRGELLEKLGDIASYLPSLTEYHEHTAQRQARDIENAEVEVLRAELDEKTKAAKKVLKECKKAGIAAPVELMPYADLKECFELVAAAIASDTYVDQQLLDLYNRYGKLRKLPALKEKEKPIQPVLTRTKEVKVTVEELMQQADYIGCYLSVHPARVLYPNSTPISAVEEDSRGDIAGQVTAIKVITTKRKQEMAFIEVNDGTSSAEVTVFPNMYAELVDNGSVPTVSDIIRIKGRVEKIDPVIKIKAENIKLHRRNNGNM
jgi:DNA polymerase-3 subunit alpha